MALLVLGFCGTSLLSILVLMGFLRDPGFPEKKLLSRKNVTFVFGHGFFFAMAVAHLLEIFGLKIGFLKSLVVVPLFLAMDLLLVRLLKNKKCV